MADAGLFIGFGNAARGRESMALAAFNDAMAHFGGLEQAGDIEGFEAVLLEPHGGDLSGFILLRGEREKLARVRTSEDFQHLVARANLCVESIGVVGANLGDGLAEQMAYWGELIEKL